MFVIQMVVVNLIFALAERGMYFQYTASQSSGCLVFSMTCPSYGLNEVFHPNISSQG
jgi:hypothetical protein